MATYMTNNGKGRMAEIYRRIKANDPANSAFVLVPLSAAGTEEEGQDIDDLKALLEDAKFTEQKEGGWERKTLTDVELAAYPEPNDVDNRRDLESPEVNFGKPEEGKDTVALAVCFDENTAEGEDDSIEFLGAMDFKVTGGEGEVILKQGEIFQGS